MEIARSLRRRTNERRLAWTGGERNVGRVADGGKKKESRARGSATIAADSKSVQKRKKTGHEILTYRKRRAKQDGFHGSR